MLPVAAKATTTIAVEAIEQSRNLIGAHNVLGSVSGLVDDAARLGVNMQYGKAALRDAVEALVSSAGRFDDAARAIPNAGAWPGSVAQTRLLESSDVLRAFARQLDDGAKPFNLANGIATAQDNALFGVRSLLA